MPIPSKITAYLARHGLKPTIVAHKTVFTAYDLAQTLCRPLDAIAKTLLVKTERGFVLAVLAANVRLDLKRLKVLLGAKKLTIASEKDMVKAFKVKPGAITAFGGLHGVPVALDAGLANVKRALFPGGSFTESLELSLPAYRKSEAPTVGRFSEKTDLKLQVSTKKKPKRRPARKTKPNRPNRRPRKKRSVRRRTSV